MEQDYEGQTYGDFRGSHGKDEKEHHLAVRLSPSGGRGEETKTARIEHDFNGHQREDQVPSGEQSRQTQAEQDRGQYQGVRNQ